MKRVFILTWAAGDWVQVYLEDKIFHEGHNIPEWVWTDLLEACGATVVQKFGFPDDDGLRCRADNMCVVDVDEDDLEHYDLSDLMTDTPGAE